jgi:transglutaminase-like putative cysteine protease
LFVVLFLASAALARRVADLGSAPRASLGSKPSLLRTSGLLAICGAVAALFIITLPPVHEWALERILMRVSARSGFSQRLWLGSMRGMLLSERKVMRVHGDNVDYLRGIVYSRYLGGRWSRVSSDAPKPKRPTRSIGGGGDVVELRFVDSEPQRYFLPLDSGEIAVSSGIALVDRLGVVAPVAAEPAYRIQYRRTGERSYSVAEPDDGDLAVPPVLRSLKRLAFEWTKDAETPAAAAEAIQQHLQDDYAYSLDYVYANRRDPIVEFLLEEKVGHCEFFASAMAVLLRMRGIPARLVGGYRVTELNPVGGYYIVRERNAHAWVEAYLPERGWTTYDPTPASEIARTSTTSTSTLAGLLDAAGSGWASFLSWLDRRTWAEVLSVPALLIVLPLLIRILWRRRSRAQKGAEDAYAQSLACFDQLSATLARQGFLRRTSETIEQLARRLAEEADDAATLARDGPNLLRRYAALRYGGQGDQHALEADIRAFCKSFETRSMTAGGS